MIIKNWRKVMRKAWSLRLMLLAAVLSGVEIVLPLFADGIPRGAFAALSIVATGGAYIARFIVQKEFHGNDK
jgi:hypothetical protein